MSTDKNAQRIIVDRIKAARAERRISQEELADAVKCSQSTIARLENGQHWNPRLVEDVASVLHIQVDAVRMTDATMVREPSAEYVVGRRLMLKPGWEKRFVQWLEKYAKAVEVLVNEHGKDFRDQLEPAIIMFLEEEARIAPKPRDAGEKGED